MSSTNEIRQEFESNCGQLWQSIEKYAEDGLTLALERLEHSSATASFLKTFNDPVWGTIELYPWEVVLLDSPLLQRLRGIRQLGLAHLVYQGATHDRLQHTLGVVEASERMMRSLSRNREHRASFGKDRDTLIPEITEHHKYVVRLAALLHDIGHGPCSHASEPIISEGFDADFSAASEVLRKYYLVS